MVFVFRAERGRSGDLLLADGEDLENLCISEDNRSSRTKKSHMKKLLHFHVRTVVSHFSI